jgi:glycosyltransferase involved in cell wall biosynthesis
MKIHYWSPFFSKIATIQAVLQSADSLIKYGRKQNYNVSIIDAIGEWDEYKNEINNKINVIKLNKLDYINKIPKGGYIKSRFSYIFIFILNFFKLKKLIRDEEPDYFIIHLITSLPIFLSIFFKQKTKIILRISGLPKINIFRHFFWKLFSKKIYKITCPTNETYKYLKEKKIFNEEKLLILKDPIINIRKFSTLSRIKLEKKFLNKKIITGIGRLTKQKNFELLINFFSKIEKNYPDFILVILGEGEQREKLQKLIDQFTLQDKVFLLGHEQNVYKFLSNSKYFILSSLWEDPGFVLVEAALSNTTIISSNCPNGPNEIIFNRNFLFDNNNKNDLIKKFENIENNIDSDSIFKQKLNVKKRIKQFTKFNHYQNLKKIVI